MSPRLRLWSALSAVATVIAVAFAPVAAHAQSAPPDTSGSDSAVIVVGVLLVTIVVIVVVIRTQRRPRR